MAKFELKGKVNTVGPITVVGENKTELQYLILTVAGYNDGFGDPKPNELWCLQAMGKKVAELGMTEALIGKKVYVTVYCHSKLVEPKTPDQKPFYSITADIGAIKIVP